MIDKGETRQITLNFKIGDYFPDDDRGSYLIFPLLMSWNDLIYIYQLWLIDRERLDSKEAVAKSFYSFRLLCSHLREGIKTLDAVENQPEFKKIIQNLSDEGKEKLRILHDYYIPFENSLTKKLLVPLRNTVFHYNKGEEAIKKCLSTLREKNSSIVVADKRAEARLLVADEVVTCHVGEIIKEIGLTLKEAMLKVNEMVTCFLDSIEHLLVAYLEMKGFPFDSPGELRKERTGIV